MKRVISFVAGLVTVFVISTPAFAQQDRKAAIVVTAPGSIGVLLPTNDSVAIRPDFSFTKSSNDITIGSTTTTFDTWQIGAGISGLFYMGKPEAFRTYWSPRFAVTHQDSNSSGANSYTASGSFGAQYGLGDRFHVFGELGLSYGWTNTDTTSTTSLGSATTTTSKSHAFGTRSVVGIAFNF